ncbi:glucose dehydrogenase [FAD, quinone] isoform X2 [Folsomia candida]|nr:glucose dehydrogenase [FAD, quinone] isoform X2 [Folsomia candida]
MMGGSGSHNYNGYARGSPLDYDTSRDIGILINEDKMAYGVTYLRHGIPQIAHASRDVIISAGAILSPLMLMKSGVGPPQILRDANIPIHEALPGVGQNLGDHPLAQLTFEIGNAAAAAAFDAILPESDFEKELIKFHSTPRDGVFAKIRAQQAFLVSSRAKENGEKGWPDILLISTLFPEQNTSQMYFSIALGRPRSRGSVTLNRKAYLSREVNDENLAAIDLGSLADHTDLEVMLEALRMVLKIKETSAFKRLDLKLSSVIPPSCKIYRFDSNNFWKCYITHTTKTFWHYSGTCKMGPKSDPFAVVDSKFRVFGIRALRVVDASVLPMSTGSNTNAPTLLVAEKAACCILRNHLQPNFGDKFCPLDYPWLFKPVVDPHK